MAIEQLKYKSDKIKFVAQGRMGPMFNLGYQIIKANWADVCRYLNYFY